MGVFPVLSYRSSPPQGSIAPDSAHMRTTIYGGKLLA